MPSIFHSEKTVLVDGTQYKIEADYTIEGVGFFKVTNIETGESETCSRQGNVARIKNGLHSMPDDMIQALERAEEVEVQ